MKSGDKNKTKAAIFGVPVPVKEDKKKDSKPAAPAVVEEKEKKPLTSVKVPYMLLDIIEEYADSNEAFREVLIKQLGRFMPKKETKTGELVKFGDELVPVELLKEVPKGATVVKYELNDEGEPIGEPIK